MRRIAFILTLLLSVPAAVSAQRDSTAYALDIERVEIAAQRPLAQIGVQRTTVDSAVLYENVATSLADALTAGSTIFIKSYGRATLATASFRGTSPSHTQVTWNGMRLNSPMLGQVDFSLIPSYFIDDAEIFHGASSVGITGGGLGGAIALATKPVRDEGLGMRYIQGVGSFKTFDEFLHLTYGGRKWGTSTRVLYSSSDNDFKYRNYDRKDFVLDPDGNVVGSYYPLERNRNGAFHDLHLMQELYYSSERAGRFSLAAWYLSSHRGLAMLDTDRNKERSKKNTQDERTLRVVGGWERLRGGLKLAARAGYTYTDMQYLQLADAEGKGNYFAQVDSRSYVHTLFAKAEAEYCLGEKWSFSADVTGHQHHVSSGDHTVLDAQTGEHRDKYYREARFEASAFAAVKWRPVPRLGLAVNVRGELYGDEFSPVIPAAFVDYLLSRHGNVVLKASAARNFRFPTLNDLYFQPGGNPDLRPEKGWTWDAGAEFSVRREGTSYSGSATFFESGIDDWILWVNSGTKLGIMTPLNVKRVHSYGVEVKANVDAKLGGAWRLFFDGNFAWTRSVNRGEPFSPADRSVGRQLVYIPEFSGAFTARLSWRTWTLGYKWCWYSERYTMSSNDPGVLGSVEPYLMNDLSLEKGFDCRWARISLKGCVNNLFNEDYISVLSRPMARRNYAVYIGITPKFGKR